MAYRQYTQCVSPADFGPPPGGGDYAAAAAFAFTTYMALSTILSGTSGWGPVIIAALIALLVPLIMYCHWWLYGRLVCLGGERCAVGLLVSTNPPGEKSGFDQFDTDYSINLLLAPHDIGDDQASIESDGIQGELIRNQTAGLGLGFEGKKEPDGTAVLHCEFEGAGVYDLYIAFIVALGFAIAAGVAEIICLLGIPIVSWIACIIAIILAVIALAISLIALPAALSDTGDPADVGLGALHEMKDVLVVEGEWVLDPVHEGWNEIHPIRHAQWLLEWTGAWPDDFQSLIDRACAAIGNARDPLTIENQRKPENKWRIHPLVDGCRPDQDDEEPDVPS